MAVGSLVLRSVRVVHFRVFMRELLEAAQRLLHLPYSWSQVQRAPRLTVSLHRR